MLALNRVNNTAGLSTGNWEVILARDPITNTLHVTFNNIPAGTFVMGSPEGETGRGSDEQQHKVTISKAFYIQTTEVTQGEWKEVMGIQPWKGTSSIKEGKTYRLPTEAEWEYTCRAGTQTTWSFGDDEKELGNYAWHYKNSGDDPPFFIHQVGLKEPNAFGLYDMHGNVYEWCHDIYGEDYYNQSPEKDPTGPAAIGDSLRARVFRGGASFNVTQRDLTHETHSASRNDISVRSYSYELSFNVGFRLVRELDSNNVEGLQMQVAAEKPAMKKVTAVTVALAKGDWKTVLALDPDNIAGLRMQSSAEQVAAQKAAVEVLARAPITNTIGMTFKEIPAGTFMMGSAETEKVPGYDEHTHKVTITNEFYMQTTEVTQGQWKEVMGIEPWKRQRFSGFVREGVNYPAVYVSWENAVVFCEKLSEKEGKTYRLPTEAEWEYACRAGTKTRWSFGNDVDALGNYAWYAENADNIGEKYAHQVRLKKPNPFGLYDMHGNVLEWCLDYYSPSYYKSSPEKDPTGPASGASRGLRGGSWPDGANYTRSADRGRNVADREFYVYFGVGFRLVRELD